MALASGAEGRLLTTMLERMLLIRAFDSRLGELYTKGLIRGSAHPAIGQEAVAVGGCFGLESGDYITSTHRGHGHAIAKGADVKAMMAELFGRANGCCRGKGGSMHIADFGIGMLGANGIVGGGLGIAAGAALAAQVQQTGRVALCFFGEGAINQGAFHEIANIAGIWNLPVVFLCENNQFAMSARVEQMTAVGDLTKRAEAYGMPGHAIDGMDAVAVRDAVITASAHARNGDGPSFLVATCYRFEGHFSGDLMPYRNAEEVEPWLARDPIEVLYSRVEAEEGANRELLRSLKETAEDAIDEAIAFAEKSAFPDPSEAWQDVYG